MAEIQLCANKDVVTGGIKLEQLNNSCQNAGNRVSEL